MSCGFSISFGIIRVLIKNIHEKLDSISSYHHFHSLLHTKYRLRNNAVIINNYVYTYSRESSWSNLGANEVEIGKTTSLIQENRIGDISLFCSESTGVGC